MTLASALEIGLAILVVAAGLVATLGLLRRIARILPQRRRARFARALPLLEVGLAGAAAFVLAVLLLGDRTPVLAAVGVALLALLLGAGWFAIRDLITGAVLRAEDAYEPGQRIRVDDVEGRIRGVGGRTLEIEREDGTRVRVPYSRLAAANLVRAGRTEDPSGHTFAITLPPELGPVRMLPVIRAAAMNCFFVSATREPQVHVTASLEGHRYDVTVFTLDRIFLPEVERAVRRRVERERG